MYKAYTGIVFKNSMKSEKYAKDYVIRKGNNIELWKAN